MEVKCAASVTGRKLSNTFFYCAYARFFWRAIHLVFGLAPPKDVDDLFNHWLKQGGSKPNLYLLTGIGYVLGDLAL